MNKYPDPKEVLHDTIVNDVRAALRCMDATVLAANELYKALELAEIFGFVISNQVSVGRNYFTVSMHNISNCHDLLPLFELLDRHGFVANGSRDWPEFYNRDYTFKFKDTSIGMTFNAYFVEGNCQKVLVKTTPEYRMECSMADGAPASEPAPAVVVPDPAADPVDTDIPF